MDQKPNTIDTQAIKRKSLSGVLALTSRTFILQIIAFAATFLLTIFLTPAVFGVFYVVSAIIAFLSYFSDVGLAAALIQKKSVLTEQDLSTTFTIQQLMVGTVSVLMFYMAPKVAEFYHLDASGLMLLRALTISFFLSSLKTIPSVLLERSLEFQKLIVPQILETVGFYAVAVVLAWQGRGIESFTWATLVRAVVGLVAIYVMSPWKVRIGIHRPEAVRLLKFGLPFQMNSFLALLKDDLMTVFLGKILPFGEVGYIGWAKKWADVPLRLIMDSIIRVTFPTFSRLQESKEHLKTAIEKTLFGMAGTVLPVGVGLLFFIEPVVSIIPKYGKWYPALPSFYLLAAAALIASLSTPLTNALNALGKINITLGLMVMWTTVTWVLTLIFIPLFGFHGFALSILLVTFTIGIVVKLVKSVVPFDFWKSIRWPLAGAILLSLYYAALLRIIPHTWVPLIGVGLSGVILYGAFVWATSRQLVESILSGFRK